MAQTPAIQQQQSLDGSVVYQIPPNVEFKEANGGMIQLILYCLILMSNGCVFSVTFAQSLSVSFLHNILLAKPNFRYLDSFLILLPHCPSDLTHRKERSQRIYSHRSWSSTCHLCLLSHIFGSYCCESRYYVAYLHDLYSAFHMVPYH